MSAVRDHANNMQDVQRKQIYEEWQRDVSDGPLEKPIRHAFVVVPQDDGYGYFIYVPDCPGCMTHADSDHEVMLMIRDAYRLWTETVVADGGEVPPVSDINPDWWGKERL
jgi:predicted RNase H-like HicB family nuclease